MNRVTIEAPEKEGGLLHVVRICFVVLFFELEVLILKIIFQRVPMCSFLTFAPIIFSVTLSLYSSAPRSKRTYDLNTQLDGFLRTYAGSPFPEAVDANEKELNEVISVAIS